jgi:hypothetical protein
MIITTILLAFGFLALTPNTQAVLPPPDGGYPGGNTAEGEDALFSLTGGFGNTAIGFHALFGDTTGGGNTATGFEALRTNNGSNITATGEQALVSNTTGQDNTANGSGALFSNRNGGQNTAVGHQALPSNGTICGYSMGFRDEPDYSSKLFQEMLRHKLVWRRLATEYRSDATSPTPSRVAPSETP